jgi:hypothetical protein
MIPEKILRLLLLVGLAAGRAESLGPNLCLRSNDLPRRARPLNLDGKIMPDLEIVGAATSTAPKRYRASIFPVDDVPSDFAETVPDLEKKKNLT